MQMDQGGIAGWTPRPTFFEYELLRKIGSGGMGEVYLARDTLLDRLVAVKFIGALKPDAATRAQFLTEARAAARVQHPNVVIVHRVGELEDRPFIVSEFIRGESLDTVETPLPWKRVLELAIGLSRGLAAAHRRGVLHRDIKPGNAILGEDGQVKLLDFGLAKLVETSSLVSEGAAAVKAARAASAEAVTQLGPASAQEQGSPASAALSPDDAHRTALDAGEAEAHARPAAAPPTAAPTPAADPKEAETGVQPSADSHTLVAGTPLYMPPEIWRGEPATRRSDVYSLGALLFELCVGVPPHAGVPLAELARAVANDDPPELAMVAPSVDPRLAAVVQRCLRQNPAERFASGDELRDALEQVLAARPTAAVPEGNPYRGLLPFEAEHRALFFGRSSEIGTIVEHLRFEPFVLVAGESGVGKSSLCRAGVLPLAAEGALADGRRWEVREIVPGRRPLAALAAALGSVLEVDEARIVEMIRADPGRLGGELRARLGEARGLLLFVDQLEELITVSDPIEGTLLGEVLGHLAARSPSLRLLASVRGDFLARLAAVPGLGDEIQRALYLLRPLSRDKVREAVVGPARAKGISFESDALVEMLVESAARADGSLPLLQFALAELWDARPGDSGVITAASLEALGGVAGALARHADSVLLGLSPPQRAVARRILSTLVTAEGVRVRRTEDELASAGDAARPALDALVRGRLLVARDADHGSAFEIAHEALIRGWDTLRRWLDEQVEGRAVKLRLTASAAEWERLGRSREALWSARQLSEAEIVDARDIAPREAAFLAASRRAIRRRRGLLGAVVVGLPLAAIALYGAARIEAARDLDRRVSDQLTEGEADYAAAVNKDKEVEALRRKAFAEFDSMRAEDGERTWSRVLALSVELDESYQRASQALEAALILDGARNDVRTLLGDVLSARASAAERDQRLALRDELVQRMGMYDTSGERRRHWHAPARVAIESSPPGATVTLARYAGVERQKWSLVDARTLGVTPLEGVELASGSYALTLTAEGRVAVSYPVRLGRGEVLRVAVPMPRASEIPRGFIYIPPGRFLFGSADDETVRRAFLTAVPIHEVSTDAYLIAKHETTFAEWIEFLQSMPPDARARRALEVGKGSLTGSIGLRELRSGSWELSIQPTTQTLVARSGETVVYPSRKSRASQDWLRFPVSGMPLADAAAYATWLDATGRVRGARICTEHEWERAARGADQRLYPHGDFLEPDDANFDQTYGKGSRSMGPDEIGSHPASTSPFGVDDMAGNVFELTVSSLQADQPLLRGGAYFYDEMMARSTNRTVIDADFRDPRLGLRLCASLHAH